MRSGVCRKGLEPSDLVLTELFLRHFATFVRLDLPRHCLPSVCPIKIRVETHDLKIEFGRGAYWYASSKSSRYLPAASTMLVISSGCNPTSRTPPSIKTSCTKRENVSASSSFKRMTPIECSVKSVR